VYKKKDEELSTKSSHDQSTDDPDSAENRSYASDTEIEVEKKP
jgi:hypothetical protein